MGPRRNADNAGIIVNSGNYPGNVRTVTVIVIAVSCASDKSDIPVDVGCQIIVVQVNSGINDRYTNAKSCVFVKVGINTIYAVGISCGGGSSSSLSGGPTSGGLGIA